jgi:GNAT superfamily N-acetyltransferase
MQPREYHRGDYRITTDSEKIEAEKVHAFLSQHSYWAQNRALEAVKHSMEHSLNFGVFHGCDLVGFARVVTDYTTFAWLCDVIVVPEHRGHGLGIWLVECVTTYPELEGIKRIFLATRDAHELYAKYGGFQVLNHPERWMERVHPQAS